MAIKMALTTFPVAFPTKLRATQCGHIYSLQHEDDLWNGAVVAKGDYASLDLYKAADATKMDAKIVDIAANGNYYVEIQSDLKATDALLVYNAPVIEEEWTKAIQAESNYYIPSTEEARAYSLVEGDIIELSADAFSGTPKVGSTITSIVDKKWVVGE